VSSTPTPDHRPPLYPYELAIINCILLLFAAGAVLQPDELALRPKITGTIALVAIAALHLWRTQQSGYLPGAATNSRLAGRRNIPGGFTVVAIALDLVAVAGMLVS